MLGLKLLALALMGLASVVLAVQAGRLAGPAAGPPGEAAGGTAVLVRPAVTETRAAPATRIALAVAVVGFAAVVACVTVLAYAHRLVETAGAFSSLS